MADELRRPTPASDYLTTEEAAEMIGMQPGTLADWRSDQREGQPPFVKIGARVWYRKSALSAWMEKQSVTY